LLGRRTGNFFEVSDIIPMATSNNSRTSFTIDPQELFAAYRQAEDRQLDVIGIFHSHPAAASPSETDLQFMELNPVVWLIYSTISHECQAFILEDELKGVEVDRP